MRDIVLGYGTYKNLRQIILGEPHKEKSSVKFTKLFFVFLY